MSSTDDRTTTGDRKAIAQEAANAAVRLERERTPPLGHADSAEVYEIAERVVVRERPAHMMECEDKGPACKLSRRITTIEERMREMDIERAEEKGANRELAREAGRSAALRMAAISAGLSLVVGLGLFALNRAWPTHASASTTIGTAQR
jgi:hypothetical protein